MTTINRKREIVRSLNELDDAQSEKVLGYIRGLLHGERSDLRHQYLKSKAMKEIGQALGQSRYTF